MFVHMFQIDRLFQWQSNPHADIVNTIKKQKANTKAEFDERAQKIVVEFAEQVCTTHILKSHVIAVQYGIIFIDGCDPFISVRSKDKKEDTTN